MADSTTADLSDDQIERLLQEAEVRLATKQQSQDEKSLTKPASLEVAATAQSTTQSTTQQSLAAASLAPPKAQQSEELSVRVPELRKSKKEMAQTAKPDAGAKWFNLPKTNLTPELKRDLQLIKMRSTLDAKRFYKKDNARSAVPEYSQVGTIIEGPTEFFSSRMTKKERKRTLLEEVLDNERETKKFKSKYNEIQTVKMSGRKGHYKKMMQKRYGNKS
ncbi:Fcf2 pre-rRNA processing-domain-containing protein [Microdochium bolleyi]|uniref:Fcf2 pre-rRNA processing-domain-containing protein n=1 Tax=Microdochium bolleyi TaxID=196109 RepID=A0A136JB38_9PEZI|nr:Fcf2 pre-rRNA processing-domain-containing protein [Microdochium bolleyi]